MRIAVAGKGGVGKTTISGTLARLLSRRVGGALAVDGDSNPNLGVALGLPQATAMDLPTVPRAVMARRTAKSGSRSRSRRRRSPAATGSTRPTACAS